MTTAFPFTQGSKARMLGKTTENPREAHGQKRSVGVSVYRIIIRCPHEYYHQ